MDEIDRRLQEAGEEWRATQGGTLLVNPAWFVDRRPWLTSRSLVALAAGAVLVVAVIGAAAVTGRLPTNLFGGGTGNANCAITRPVPVYTPPSAWPAHAPGVNEWYGSDALWVMLPRDGVVWNWSELPRDEHGISDKSFWWSAMFTSGIVEPRPEITVTAVQLDGDGRSVTEPPGTHAGAHDLGLAMLTGLTIPAPGCWQITGDYKGASLSYVMQVTP